MPQMNEKYFLDAYDKYADDIYRYCFSRVYDKELAEDLTQETFIKTWTHISKGREVINIKAFLYRVAINLIIDNSRKKKTFSLEGLEESGIGITKDKGSLKRHGSIGNEESFFERFAGQEMVKILDKLDEKYKQVITMRYINDLLPSEIADILNQSSNAVSVRINQGMKKLRNFVDKKDFYGK